MPNRTLLGQTQRVLSALLERPVGMLGDNNKDVQEVTVSTIQTAARFSKVRDFRKYLESVPVLIGDEVHLMGARGMWVDVTRRTPAYVKVGFTATALRRHDVGDVGLVAAFGDVVYKLPSIALMRAGVLANVHIYLCAVTEPNNLSWASWERAFEEGMVEHARVNPMAGAATKRFLAAGRSTYDHRLARPRLAPRNSRVTSMHGFPNDDGVQDHSGRPAAPSEGAPASGLMHTQVDETRPSLRRFSAGSAQRPQSPKAGLAASARFQGGMDVRQQDSSQEKSD